MVDLLIPVRTGSIYQERQPAAEVWVAGRRRVDAVVSEYSLSAGAELGTCTIDFRPTRRTARAYERYDAALCRENDLVEVAVNPVGVVWRGTITGRASDPVSLSYTATDLLAKLNNTVFPHEYNFRDDVTQERKYVYTARQIAADAEAFYLAWHEIYTPEDPLLSIDLASFPETVPNETAIEGQGLLDGLRQLLEMINYRWRMGVTHSAGASVVRAFAIGQSQRRRAVSRGHELGRSPLAQPGGRANVAKITKRVESSVVSHIYGDGAPRVIERAFPLTQHWGLVADDYTPPEGHTLAEYVTEAEQAAVLAEWEKYTKETLDEKVGDDLSKASKVRNPKYRKKYEKVCREFALPAVDDTFYFNDDAEHYPQLLGELGRRPKIESDLVQTNPSGDPEVANDSVLAGTEHGPFIVYKRFDDDKLYYTFEGFSIRKNTLVEFARPFVDTVSLWLAHGSMGTGGTYDAGAKRSTYTVADPGVDLTELISAADIAAGAWLILGDYDTYYKLVSRTGSSMTVQGNTSGAGGAEENGTYKQGAGWCVVSYDPRAASAASGGVGAARGVYKIALGPEDGDYAGYSLVLGGVDADGILTATPATMEKYRIACNVAGESLVELTTDRPGETLVGKPAAWAVVKLMTERHRPYEWVKLNAAYQSVQRLGCWSGDLAPGMMNKRGVQRRNEDFKWRTEWQNYRLVRSATPGEEDKFTPVYNSGTIDRRKDLAVNTYNGGLAAWTMNQLAGTNTARSDYSVTICPIDWSIAIGDRLVDTRVDSGTTVVGLRYELDDNRLVIGAANRD